MEDYDRQNDEIRHEQEQNEMIGYFSPIEALSVDYEGAEGFLKGIRYESCDFL